MDTPVNLESYFSAFGRMMAEKIDREILLAQHELRREDCIVSAEAAPEKEAGRTFEEREESHHKLPETPHDSVGWLSSHGHGAVINEEARRKAAGPATKDLDAIVDALYFPAGPTGGDTTPPFGQGPGEDVVHRGLDGAEREEPFGQGPGSTVEEIKCLNGDGLPVKECYGRSKPSNDPVNSPSHYQTEGGIECIDAIRQALGEEGFIAGCHFAAMKYLWRAGKKGPFNEDMQKAVWFARMASGDDPRDD
jgi:hypothetical protein